MGAELLADTAALSGGGVGQPQLPFSKAPVQAECHCVHFVQERIVDVSFLTLT